MVSVSVAFQTKGLLASAAVAVPPVADKHNGVTVFEFPAYSVFATPKFQLTPLFKNVAGATTAEVDTAVTGRPNCQGPLPPDVFDPKFNLILKNTDFPIAL